MLETKFLYVVLMALSLAGPLFLSFDRKVAFYKSFVPLLFAILPVSFFFIVWDIAFTELGVWGFNEKYITWISFAGLPLGEYLFFLVIPYCCLFIYEVMKAYFPNHRLESFAQPISNFLIGFAAVIAIIYYDRLYTVFNFSLLALTIIYFSKRSRAPWLGRFYLAFVVICIPFLIINGILTGTLLAEEVVWYNSKAIIGLRVGTIPVEDFFYALLQIMLTTALFEHFKHKRISKSQA